MRLSDFCVCVAVFAAIHVQGLMATDIKPAIDSAARGDVAGLITQSGAVLAEDSDPALSEKACVLLAIGYTLEGGDDVKDRCLGLMDFLPEGHEKGPGSAVISYLAGKSDAAKLTSATASASKDWKAVALLAQYLLGVREKQNIRELYALTQKYKDETAGLPQDDWSLVWEKRLPRWHSWVQAGKGEPEGLEALIAASSPTSALAAGEAQAEQQKKNIESVNSIINMYLQNNPQNARQAAALSRDSLPKDEPLRVILDYLTGTAMTPEQIASATSGTAMNWALATVAIFARSLSDSEKVDQQKAFFCIDNFDGNFKFVQKTPQVALWKPRMDNWRKWCESGFKPDAYSSPEPLILARSAKDKASKEPKVGSTFRDITTVTLEEFEPGRSEKYAGRPRPASLDFDDNAFNKYLSSLPKELRDAEKLRYETIKRLKHHMIMVMERTPFPGGLITKNGRRSGVVYMANVNIVRLKRSPQSKKGESYKWEDLSFEQYPAFLEFFAKRRLAVSGAAEVSKEDQRRGAANEFLGLAILCDWFGRYEEALKFANEAVKTDPGTLRTVSKMMLD